MYRHLLVPIDATDLSIEVVSDAVGLARSLGARITFFHAAKDPSASLFSDAEVVRAVSPEKHAYAYAGKARELLAKAEAAARAFSVPCDSIQRASDKTAEAIIAAARETSCDLIFMASHGRRSKLGMALASETLNVLMNAGLPVLVAATGDPRPPAHAIGVIRDEHRSLAAVLHAWMRELAGSRTAMTVPDARLVRAMLLYIERFPVAQHHPKEEQHLFARLRERTTSVNAELDELERQHVQDRELVSGLRGEVDSLYATGDTSAQRSALARLEDAVNRYAAFTWEHLGREEGVILPAAQRFLTESDWVAIDAAFAENRDPGFSGETEQDFRMLFSRIVNLEAAMPPR
jgi:nucleotide-binding universal stress UspA family protein/hemerythrin-like domain-containing protein